MPINNGFNNMLLVILPCCDIDGRSLGCQAHPTLPDASFAAFLNGDIERLRYRGSRGRLGGKYALILSVNLGEAQRLPDPYLTTPTPGVLLTLTR